MSSWLYFGIICAIIVVQVAAAAYGDFKSEGKWPWQDSKNGVNSGSKFG